MSNMLSATLEKRGGRIRIDEVIYNSDERPTYWIR